MKKFDLVTVLGVSGCIIMLVAMLYFMPRQKRQAEPANAAGQVTQAPETAENQPAEAAETGETPVAAPVAAAVDESQHGRSVNAEAETLAGPGGECIFSYDPAEGGLRSVELLKHALNKKEADRHVTLGREDFPFLALVGEAAGIKLNPGEVKVSEDGRNLVLARASEDGRFSVTETWTFGESSDDYGIKYNIAVRNNSEAAANVSGIRVEVGALPPSIGGLRKTRMGESSGGVSCGLVEKNAVDNMSTRDLTKKMNAEKIAALAVRQVRWLGVHSKYFLLNVRAGWDGGFRGMEANVLPASANGEVPAHFHARAILPDFSLAAGETKEFAIDGYAGPKEFSRLHEMGGNIETVMEMDRFFFGRAHWMGWLSRVLLAGMIWISQWFPPSIAYGMGIIFLTILVKLIFWPLSRKSHLSMKKMQALQPQLKELREKYKDDPQKMYAKQQELFKANNVSQLGGCLPMLLQIPVFFALFNTFRNAIELRMAGFLWVADLSMPDDLPFSLFGLPIRPCALLMGASMYLQQRMTPSADPNQAKMMSIMSIVFIFMFYSMPSALTLYMTVNQLLSIIQMAMMRRLDHNDTTIAVAVKEK